MAALPPVFFVVDNMAACDIENNPIPANLHDGATDAQRLATDLFQDDFQSVMTIDFNQLATNFKTYAQLTQAEGRIRVRVHQQKNIRAFIQWARDRIRMGQDPSQVLFPVNQAQIYIDRLSAHNRFVANSTDVRRPGEFTDDMLWEEFEPRLINYMRRIPGATGIPLSYVVRADENPDPTPHTNFLDDYVSMAPHNGATWEEDNASVYVLIYDLVSGHTRARGAIAALALGGAEDGRSAFYAVKVHFEGEGILQVRVTNAEWVIDHMYYNGESAPTMWWTKFEQELNRAFAILDAEAGRVVYTDEQKLRKLQKKIKADFLQQQKINIDAALAHIPMTMQYSTALTIYRNAVRNKYPVERQGNNQRRRVAEANQGRDNRGRNNRNGGGHGRGGRGNDQGNRRGGNGGNRRNHPDQETIVLMNNKRIKYHPSYRFTWEEMNQMTQGQKDRLARERAEYRQSQGRGPRRNVRESVAEMSRQIAELRNQIVTGSVGGQDDGQSVPGQVSTGATQRTQVSQVTIGSAFGGRNEQAQQRQQGRGNRM